MISLHRQHGAAIIVALFVTALVAAMAVAMIERLRLDTRRTELLLNANQAYFDAQGSVAWAMDQLNNNWKLQQKNKLIDNTPIKLSNKQNNAVITSKIEDAQGYFNLNNLGDMKNQLDFIRLIRLVSPKTDEKTAQKITLAIADWIKPGIKGSPLDKYYAELNPPYQAPHRPMVSASEMRLVMGMTSEIYNQLIPYVIALPDPTPININSAPAPILMSLSKTLKLEGAKAIIQARQQTPFLTTQQFTSYEIVKNNPIPEDKITVTSNYFLVQSKVIIGQQHTLLYTLLNRMTKDQNSSTYIVWQTKGTL